MITADAFRNSKRLIIRGIWGESTPTDNPVIKRIEKVKEEASNADHELLPIDSYIVLCFGRRNYDNLSEQGYQTLLIFDQPFLFDPRKEQYRHKLFCYEYAFDRLGAEEILWLDWDCEPQRKINIEELWKYKSDFAANLMVYNVRKCPWREEHKRTIPNGGYLYMQSHLIEPIIREWETLEDRMNDEVAYAKFLDKRDGKFDPQKYLELYEPSQCIVESKSAYSYTNPDASFVHYLGQRYR